MRNNLIRLTISLLMIMPFAAVGASAPEVNLKALSQYKTSKVIKAMAAFALKDQLHKGAVFASYPFGFGAHGRWMKLYNHANEEAQIAVAAVNRALQHLDDVEQAKKIKFKDEILATPQMLYLGIGADAGYKHTETNAEEETSLLTNEEVTGFSDRVWSVLRKFIKGKAGAITRTIPRILKDDFSLEEGRGITQLIRALVELEQQIGENLIVGSPSVRWVMAIHGIDPQWFRQPVPQEQDTAR